MLRQSRIVRKCALAAGCAVLATISTFGAPPRQAQAATAPPSPESDPITLAAAYIGVPTSTLAAHIVTETRQTGTLGIQVVIDQLDEAMARQLSALPPTIDESIIMAHYSVIASHHTIRDALLDQAVTGLKGALGG